MKLVHLRCCSSRRCLLGGLAAEVLAVAAAVGIEAVRAQSDHGMQCRTARCCAAAADDDVMIMTMMAVMARCRCIGCDCSYNDGVVDVVLWPSPALTATTATI